MPPKRLLPQKEVEKLIEQDRKDQEEYEAIREEYLIRNKNGSGAGPRRVGDSVESRAAASELRNPDINEHPTASSQLQTPPNSRDSRGVRRSKRIAAIDQGERRRLQDHRADKEAKKLGQGISQEEDSNQQGEDSRNSSKKQGADKKGITIAADKNRGPPIPFNYFGGGTGTAGEDIIPPAFQYFEYHSDATSPFAENQRVDTPLSQLLQPFEAQSQANSQATTNQPEPSPPPRPLQPSNYNPAQGTINPQAINLDSNTFENVVGFDNPLQEAQQAVENREMSDDFRKHLQDEGFSSRGDNMNSSSSVNMAETFNMGPGMNSSSPTTMDGTSNAGGIQPAGEDYDLSLISQYINAGTPSPGGSGLAAVRAVSAAVKDGSMGHIPGSRVQQSDVDNSPTTMHSGSPTVRQYNLDHTQHMLGQMTPGDFVDGRYTPDNSPLNYKSRKLNEGRGQRTGSSAEHGESSSPAGYSPLDPDGRRQRIRSRLESERKLAEALASLDESNASMNRPGDMFDQAAQSSGAANNLTQEEIDFLLSLPDSDAPPQPSTSMTNDGYSTNFANTHSRPSTSMTYDTHSANLASTHNGPSTSAAINPQNAPMTMTLEAQLHDIYQQLVDCRQETARMVVVHERLTGQNQELGERCKRMNEQLQRLQGAVAGLVERESNKREVGGYQNGNGAGSMSGGGGDAGGQNRWQGNPFG